MGKNLNGSVPKKVNAVERALLLLEAMAQAGGPISITELAKKTGLTPGTVHRLLYTMMQRGFVEQNEADNRYKLGLKVFQLGNMAAHFKDLYSAARPVMEELQQKYNETVNLATLDGSEVVYVDQVESTNIVVVRMFARKGSRGSAHCTAVGKVLLAGLPEEQLEKTVSSMALEKYTNETITDPQVLMKEIQRVRRDGYALDMEEREEGVRCIAAPVKDYEGKVVAAISISGPTSRITTHFIKNELTDAVKEAAAKISRRLGFYE